MLADLDDLTGESAWLEGGLHVAGAIVDAYIDGDLPRGSLKTEFYEFQLGPADLLYVLTRLALLANDETRTPGPDYTLR